MMIGEAMRVRFQASAVLSGSACLWHSVMARVSLRVSLFHNCSMIEPFLSTKPHNPPASSVIMVPCVVSGMPIHTSVNEEHVLQNLGPDFPKPECLIRHGAQGSVPHRDHSLYVENMLTDVEMDVDREEATTANIQESQHTGKQAVLQHCWFLMPFQVMSIKDKSLFKRIRWQ